MPHGAIFVIIDWDYDMDKGQLIAFLCPLLLIWFNFDTSMDT